MTAAAVKEKETKINELIEELGNKEMLLSEAQAQLESVRGVGGMVDCSGGWSGCSCTAIVNGQSRV